MYLYVSQTRHVKTKPDSLANFYINPLLTTSKIIIISCSHMLIPVKHHRLNLLVCNSKVELGSSIYKFHNNIIVVLWPTHAIYSLANLFSHTNLGILYFMYIAVYSFCCLFCSTLHKLNKTEATFHQ